MHLLPCFPRFSYLRLLTRDPVLQSPSPSDFTTRRHGFAIALNHKESLIQLSVRITLIALFNLGSDDY